MSRLLLAEMLYENVKHQLRTKIKEINVNMSLASARVHNVLVSHSHSYLFTSYVKKKKDIKKIKCRRLMTEHFGINCDSVSQYCSQL